MKKCNSCGKEKSATQDNFQRDRCTKSGFRGRCKECSLSTDVVIRQDKKQRLVDRFGGGCELCKYNKCLAALEFHHKDPSQKKFSVSGGNLRSKKFEALEKEAKKCVLLCANCHREVHHNESQ